MEKKNTGLIIFVIILILLVVGLGGFIIYDKVLSTNNTNNTSDTNKENNNTKLLTNDEAIAEGKRLYDKATEIYETWVFTPYCGVVRNNIAGQDIEVLGNSNYGNTMRYYKSNFSSIEDLKKYLKQWLSEDIINNRVVKSYKSNGETYYEYVEDDSLLSNYDPHYGYVDYVLKNNTLYCRLDALKGWLTLYQDKYDIKVDSIEENKITYTITSTYCKNDSGCVGVSPCSCSESDLEYKDTKFVIEKNSTGNFVVTEYTLHN